MEISNGVSCFSGVTTKTHQGSNRPFIGSTMFQDVQYYNNVGVPRCGGKKEKGMVMTTTKKKKLKLFKGLSKDLSMFSELGFDESKGKMISEAAELLLKELEQLRAEEKEMKRQRKHEKAKLKAMRINDCESSSSSSSESECCEVIDARSLRSKKTSEQSCIGESQPLAHEEATQIVQQGQSEPVAHLETIPELASLSPQVEIYAVHTQTNCFESRNSQKLEEQCSCSGSRSSGCCLNVEERTLAAATKRIEVCMGGKCKKSGAAELLQEFEKVIGVEGAVVGCKCMGKCRDGPNVRVLNCCDDNERVAEGVEKSVRRNSTNLPLCIGVGLEDVGLLVTKFFGGDGNGVGLAAAT